MSNKPQDVNSREYWEWAVNNPVEAGLNVRQVNAMKESLDMTDPSYWEKVMADPNAHGFAREHAAQLANHFLKERKAREPTNDEVVGWCDYHLEAAHWSALSDVAPTDAAMLLCRFNPNEQSYADARLTTTDELGPEHLVRLGQRLADISKTDPRPRTLRDWHQTARKNGLAYHSWIDGYMEATAERVAGSTPPEPQPALVVNETVEQRRARHLALFEIEEKLGRGALQRVADSVGVDRSNLSKDLAKARAARSEKKRSGEWTSQLVQGGKRKV